MEKRVRVNPLCSDIIASVNLAICSWPTAINTEERFLRDFLVILKRILQNMHSFPHDFHTVNISSKYSRIFHSFAFNNYAFSTGMNMVITVSLQLTLTPVVCLDVFWIIRNSSSAYTHTHTLWSVCLTIPLLFIYNINSSIYLSISSFRNIDANCQLPIFVIDAFRQLLHFRISTIWRPL